MDYESRVRETERILREWDAKRGHDRCFSHNDILGQLLELYEIARSPQFDDLSDGELEKGCTVYRAMLQGKPIPPELAHIAEKIKL